MEMHTLPTQIIYITKVCDIRILLPLRCNEMHTAYDQVIEMLVMQTTTLFLPDIAF